MTELVAINFKDQPGARYILPRNEPEEYRLNGQHAVIIAAVYEGRLVYDTSVELDAGSRVLDSGTGTGVWLLDLAQNMSGGIELHGIDVSDSYFPDVHPQNVDFQITSVTNLPAKWIGYFDLIHQRLLLGALTAENWRTALSEIFRALKPGGSLQLAELHVTDVINAGPAWSRVRDCFDELLARRSMLSDCAVQLPRMLEEAGFVNVTATRGIIPIGDAAGEMGKMASVYTMVGFRNLAPAMLSEGLIASNAEWEELMLGVERECKGPVCMYQAMWIICARRPL